MPLLDQLLLGFNALFGVGLVWMESAECHNVRRGSSDAVFCPCVDFLCHHTSHHLLPNRTDQSLLKFFVMMEVK